MILINSYDLDGVVFMGQTEGLRPGPNDIIVTGRSFTQKEETLNILRGRGIYNFVFFNSMSRSDFLYNREESGKHKAKVIKSLRDLGVAVMLHFEDDPLQAEIINKVMPTYGKVVMIGDGVFEDKYEPNIISK